jgi:protein KRI1
MRRKDTRRAEARAAIKARKVEESARKAEELKRLKNLKKEEIAKRLQKIAEVAGADMKMFEDVDLTGEFDSAKFDEMMAKKFNDDYYADEDDAVKPVFDDDGLEELEAQMGAVEEEDEDFDLEGVVDDELGPKTGMGKVQLKQRAMGTENEEGVSGGYDDEEDYQQQEEDGGWGGEGGYNGEEEDFIMDADYLPGGELYSGKQSGKQTSKKNTWFIKQKKIICKSGFLCCMG